MATARDAAYAYACHAKSDDTRRAYRAGVRASCAWCETHALPCLPTGSANIVAFLAAERGQGVGVSPLPSAAPPSATYTFIADLPVPTAEAPRR
ncbi:hypothetical protein [Acidisoma silvae]|uniref:hypothetical protein n=1 Tax=Acidisoma silvae TaxID=2802396 RepID=UPI001D0AB783|nr:hypothetical protein [Acidisoma silvae]